MACSHQEPVRLRDEAAATLCGTGVRLTHVISTERWQTKRSTRI